MANIYIKAYWWKYFSIKKIGIFLFDINLKTIKLFSGIESFTSAWNTRDYEGSNEIVVVWKYLILSRYLLIVSPQK